MKKFFGAEDAARYAASLNDRWQTEDGEIWDAETLIGAAEYADSENPLDEDDNNAYYAVDENGAVGMTYDNGAYMYWWVTPVEVKVKAAFCPHCGAEVKNTSVFCPQCGGKL